jgi:hypothetical protein
MRKKSKVSSDGGNSGSKKWKRGCDGVYGVVLQSLHLVGVWNQLVHFVLVHLAGIRFQLL